ncbi:MAG: 16S rRNA (cytosine(1402)-N(4))-methyltransferase RsmH [Planctomycetota bacterium]|nr:16S rRNA (cytosine(1402)-N(4))-methyltransferase RsmH [Planctomycetota bacterium]MDI6787139.1 16S rRNA (cytosine(1402)-N(4))-methyltransferase RsmH [Planctomycetota bacterium]
MHQPVLIKEVIKYLGPEPSEIVVDGTIGLGGHSQTFLEKTNPHGRLIGIDLDKETLCKAQERLKLLDNTLHLFCDNFVNTGAILEGLGLKTADVIFLDLGVSSYQLDSDIRGFSFLRDGPLDMRMSLSPGTLNAGKVVNQYSSEMLEEVFRNYGEERLARRIARQIVKHREKEPIKTTTQLAQIIKRAIFSGWQRIHPATRVFQALRIEVNKELDNLKDFLARVPEWLSANGRVGIISFHSLEDRLVKTAFRDYHKTGILEIITRKPITPDSVERQENPRSRSAKFRVAVRVIPKGKDIL